MHKKTQKFSHYHVCNLLYIYKNANSLCGFQPNVTLSTLKINLMLDCVVKVDKNADACYLVFNLQGFFFIIKLTNL